MAFTTDQEQALLALLNEKKVTLSELPTATEISHNDLLLTRQGVVDKTITPDIIENYLIKPASLIVAGVTKLNNSVDSSSDIETATPKAVKQAYDLAVSKLSSASVTPT